jgi:acyl-coenzyme A thioesterase PaaI-like protein
MAPDTTAERPRNDANRCFVCGPENPIGLKIAFEIEAGICRGYFTPGPDHTGFDTMTHGGILFSALDDVMANWLFLQGARGYTAKCEIRYRQPVTVGTRLNLEAHLKLRKRRLFVLVASASVASTEVVVAETEASFMIEDFGALHDAMRE